MLQLQYFNSKLKNKHITNILDNYKLKYAGIKNELSSKLNELIKLFLNDILSFLETTEEISNARKKLNNYEKMKTELDSIRNQLKIKTYTEHKIKNDLETLTQENSLLKVKLNSLNQKLNNLYNNNINTSSKNLSNLSKSPLVNKNSKENINLITPKINLRGSGNNYQKIITDFRKRTNISAERKKSVENSFNKLDISMTSKFDYSSRVLETLEKSNRKIRKRKSNEDKFISLKRNTDIKKEFIQTFNSNINNTINELSIKNTNTKKKKNIKKFLINQDKLNKINKTRIDNKINSTRLFSPYQINSSVVKKNIKKERDINNFSLNNSVDNTEYEEIEKKINLAIDDELKQLEQDEEKIKKLLEKVNNGKSSELNLNEININDNQRTIGVISSIDE